MYDNIISQNPNFSGCNTKVWMCNKCVIKGYGSKTEYEECISLHDDLDYFELLPKMITHFKKGYTYYLVVEKVKLLKNINPSDPSYQDWCWNLSECQDKLLEIRNTYEGAGYEVGDLHLGNIGIKKGNWIIIDEGCLSSLKIYDNEFLDAFT